LDAGVRQRVVIHCPEGAWGVSRTEAGRWVPSWRLPPEEIVGSVGAGRGMSSFGLKGGIGTASRYCPGLGTTLGVL
ncbi:P1 family peptidase, partial [Klebsiella aerogenes]|uniref:P1 family peptidase n=1 Tax=Klebsiella aerogenes TaxID=548 RepID=UPI001F07B59E